jgi:hypothetical protein
MAFTVKKNATQKFQYENGMHTLSGKQFGSHMAHLRTEAENSGAAQKGTAASTAKA